MKIERREPVSLFRMKRKRLLRDHIRLAVAAKYAALTLVGVLLFRAGQARALAERGYEALGGEVVALFLPVLYWMVVRVARDILNIKEGKGTWR
jgi:hypothetical protein